MATEWFPIDRGIRQGHIVSPYLFNLYAEHIQKKKKKTRLDSEEAGMKTGERNINNLRYENNTVLLVESTNDLKQLLMRVKEEVPKQECM